MGENQAVLQVHNGRVRDGVINDRQELGQL